MEGVERIDQITDTKTHWVTKIGGVEREFDATSLSSTRMSGSPGSPRPGPIRPAWSRSIDSSDDTTRVTVQMDYEPEGVVENVGDKLGIVKRRVTGDLERFKTFIESRGTETGGWRGDVDAALPGLIIAVRHEAPLATYERSLVGSSSEQAGREPRRQQRGRRRANHGRRGAR